MPITVKKNFKTLKIDTPTDKRFWQAVGIDTVSTIRENTERGRDADGKSFKPYNKHLYEIAAGLLVLAGI